MGLEPLVALAAGQSSASNSSQKIERVEIQRSEVPGTNLEMRIILATYPPGAAVPVHHHPVAGINYILEGAVETAFDNDAPRTYKAGQSFQDLAIHPHTMIAAIWAKAS
jgi:quercetin dioxygenase-like cupin family protein